MAQLDLTVLLVRPDAFLGLAIAAAAASTAFVVVVIVVAVHVVVDVVSGLSRIGCLVFVADLGFDPTLLGVRKLLALFSSHHTTSRHQHKSQSTPPRHTVSHSVNVRHRGRHIIIHMTSTTSTRITEYVTSHITSQHLRTSTAHIMSRTSHENVNVRHRGNDVQTSMRVKEDITSQT